MLHKDAFHNDTVYDTAVFALQSGRFDSRHEAEWSNADAIMLLGSPPVLCSVARPVDQHRPAALQHQCTCDAAGPQLLQLDQHVGLHVECGKQTTVNPMSLQICMTHGPEESEAELRALACSSNVAITFKPCLPWLATTMPTGLMWSACTRPMFTRYRHSASMQCIWYLCSHSPALPPNQCTGA